MLNLRGLRLPDLVAFYNSDLSDLETDISWQTGITESQPGVEVETHDGNHPSPLGLVARREPNRRYTNKIK